MRSKLILASTLMSLSNFCLAPAFAADAKVEAKPAAKTSTTIAPDKQMSTVLNELIKMKGKPVEKCTPAEARKQPTLTDAVKASLKTEGKTDAKIEVGSVTDITIDGAAGKIPARVYVPTGKGPFPVIVYYHGGGFVIADINVYDASGRGLCKGANAVVIAPEYRKAPEHKFPAAHDDALAAYKWSLANAGKYQGDAKKVAIVGESAGGNLALSTTIAARDAKLQMPLREVLVYPLVDDNTHKASYTDCADAKPLNAAMIPWFAGHYFNTPADGKNPRFNLPKNNLKGLPPVTVLNAQIDPLRSDGDEITNALTKAGVNVKHTVYPGVVHEFFGAGAVLDKAKQAMDTACTDLKNSFK